MPHDPEMEDLYQLLHFHLENHDGLCIQDIYKCLYQGLYGAEHLLKNLDAARDYLLKEWDNVLPDPEGLLLDPVSTDMAVFRLNLGPHKGLGGTVGYVWDLFVRSALEFTSAPERMARTWNLFTELCFLKKLPFPGEEAVQFGRRIAQQNYPVCHHSPSYREKNKPAYRIVKLSALSILA